MDILKNDPLQIFMYGAAVAVSLIIWRTEHTDINCPSFDSTEKECKEGGGMSFSFTKPKDDDTCDILLKKMVKAAGAETNAIKWRKSLLLSVSIMFAVCLLVEGKLPDWRKFYMYVLVAFSINIGFSIYYSYHVYSTAEKWTKESAKIIKKRCLKV